MEKMSYLGEFTSNPLRHSRMAPHLWFRVPTVNGEVESEYEGYAVPLYTAKLFNPGLSRFLSNVSLQDPNFLLWKSAAIWGW